MLLQASDWIRRSRLLRKHERGSMPRLLGCCAMTIHRFLLLPVLFAMAACQHAATPAPPSPNVLLLGETHDNGDGHRLRLQDLQARIDAGWRPAIAMEQFDREQQAALDAAMRDCADADCVVAGMVTAKSGWNWTFYKQVVAVALQYRLPLLAANLSRVDAGKVVKAGFAVALSPDVRNRYDIDAALPAALLAAQVEEVRIGHCNMLPAAMLEPMARAQIARDVVMAEAMRPYLERGVVLIAGNGHVRRDIAVPYWLRAQGVPSWSIGYLEQLAAEGRFDSQRAIPPIDRPDACAGVGIMKGKGAG